jgi:hypothetical protein
MTAGVVIVAIGGLVLLIAGITEASLLPAVLGGIALVLAVAMGLGRSRKRT